jgi:putative phosphoesterase
VVRLGIISDTHGLLRAEAAAFLQGCDRIVHGGDIGNTEVLMRLSTIAPVTAVRGNNDKGAWAEAIPETACFEFGGISVYAIHDLSLLDVDPSAAGVQVVVSGHSHKPAIERRNDIVFVNPGSAGPRRFKLPISVAEILVEGSVISSRIVELEIDRAVSRGAPGATNLKVRGAGAPCNRPELPAGVSPPRFLPR